MACLVRHILRGRVPQSINMRIWEPLKVYVQAGRMIMIGWTMAQCLMAFPAWGRHYGTRISVYTTNRERLLQIGLTEIYEAEP